MVTGKGNIVASRKHAAHVTVDAVERFLGLAEGHEDEAEGVDLDTPAAASAAARVHAEIGQADPPSAETATRILERVRERQRAVGYTGDVRSWLARVTPPDLE